MAYRMIALDMDGTLLNSQGRISAENRKWIRRAIEAGIAVVLSSGRAMSAMQPYLEELELAAPVVCVNGSEVWAAPGRLHRRTLMPADWVARLHRLAADHPEAWYWAYAVDALYNRDEWCADVAAVEWLKFGFHWEDAQGLSRLRDEVSSWNVFEITNSSPYNIELNPRGVSKRTGLEEVCRLLGIGMQDAVAVGDSLNDLEMIRAAGLGVAMGNAQPAVLASADYITAGHDEDGVAQVIREWILA